MVLTMKTHNTEIPVIGPFMRYRRRRASLSPRRPSGDYAGEPRTVHQPSHRLLQLHRLLQQFLDTTTTPPQINTHTPNMLTRSTLTSSTRLSVAAARSLRAGSTWSQVPQGYVTDHLSFFRRSLAADACIATPIRRTRMMFKCWGGGTVDQPILSSVSRSSLASFPLPGSTGRGDRAGSVRFPAQGRLITFARPF